MYIKGDQFTIAAFPATRVNWAEPLKFNDHHFEVREYPDQPLLICKTCRTAVGGAQRAGEGWDVDFQAARMHVKEHHSGGG